MMIIIKMCFYILIKNTRIMWKKYVTKLVY